MALKINSTAENTWLIKRLAISASFFFGISTAQRRFIQMKLSKVPNISTCEELCASLDIQPRAWAAFMNAFFKEGGVIRNWNGKAGYHQVQNGKPEIAFRDQSLPGDAEFAKKMQELAAKLEQGGRSDDRSAEADAIREQAEREGLRDETAQEDSDEKPVGALQERLRAEKDQLEKQVANLQKQLKESNEAIAKAREGQVLSIEIKNVEKGETRELGVSHKTTPELLVRVQCGLNVYLVGPAGSGKTTAAEKVAEALSLKFGFMSVGPQTTKSDVFGYMDAKGDYVPTEFRRRYEMGGVFLFDEIDAAHAGVLTQINAALAGSVCAFPDRMVKKHDDFRCLAAGNTYGTGADRVYVGRNELDGASLDRFDFLEWAYDEALELAIVKNIALSVKGDVNVAARWTGYVQSIRRSVAKLSIRHVVSPRASINGTKLLLAGVAQDRVEATALFKSLKPEEVVRIKQNLSAR
jgi:cobaltochelatase CobS